MIIKWKYRPSGECPVESEGWFLGYYFYFRARYDYASIEFSHSEEFWDNDLIHARYILLRTEGQYSAGYLRHWICKLLIYKGCIKFLVKKNKYKII